LGDLIHLWGGIIILLGDIIILLGDHKGRPYDATPK
jgi:hypothetical protein